MIVKLQAVRLLYLKSIHRSQSVGTTLRSNEIYDSLEEITFNTDNIATVEPVSIHKFISPKSTDKFCVVIMSNGIEYVALGDPFKEEEHQ